MQEPCEQFSKDSEFFQALKELQKPAVDCLYMRMHKICIPYALSRSSKRFTEADAEDILHDAFIAVLAKIQSGNFVLTTVPITQFARIIFRNLWISFIRKRGKDEHYDENNPLEDDNGGEQKDNDQNTDGKSEEEEKTNLWGFIDGEADLEEENIWRNKINCVDSALNQLNEDCRKLMLWFYIEDISLSECSARLGIVEGYAKVKRFRCAQDFKKYYLACIN